MSAPRVSVICIFYQAERFLAEALDSVLAQDFGDWELLLVDDGSTDGGSAIARRYAAADPARIVCFEHPGHANRGMSASRNLGLHHARGEYVAMIDGDDRWYPGKLRGQVEILDQHPEVGMVCGAYRYWRSWDGGRDEIYFSGHRLDRASFPPETSLKLYPLGGVGRNPTSPMVRRALAERVGGYVDGFRGLYEDQVFLAKIYLEAPVYFDRRLWLDYRQHPASCTARADDREYARQARQFLDWLERYLSGREVPGKNRIERAIRRARWESRRPMIGRALTFLRWRRVKLARALGFSPTLPST